MVKKITSIVSKDKALLVRKALIIAGAAIGFAIVGAVATKLDEPDIIVYEGNVEVSDPDSSEPTE